MARYRELEAGILLWADEKELLSEDLMYSQLNKTVVSMGQLSVAIRMKAQNKKEFISEGSKILRTDLEIEKNLGDLLLNLVLVAEMNDLSLETCLEMAYKRRK